jgi:hypothetical protein
MHHVISKKHEQLWSPVTVQRVPLVMQLVMIATSRCDLDRLKWLSTARFSLSSKATAVSASVAKCRSNSLRACRSFCAFWPTTSKRISENKASPKTMIFREIETNENYPIRRFQSEHGVWEWGIRQVLFGSELQSDNANRRF